MAEPSAATTPSNGAPHHNAEAAAASAFGTCWMPCSASRTSPVPHGVDMWNHGRRSSSRTMRSARTSASASTAYLTIGHGLTAAIRATKGSSKFSTASPFGGNAVTSSLFARATPSRSPKYSTCAMATLVTMPTSGRPTVGQATDVACPAGAHLQDDPLDVVRRIQEGQREPELVVERPLAGRHPEGRREAGLRSRSLVVVLPTEPVMPTTPPSMRSRARTPELQERHGGVRDDDRRAADGLSLCEIGRRLHRSSALPMNSCPSRSATMGT